MAEPIDQKEPDPIDRQIEAQQARILHAKAQKLDLLAQVEEQDRVINESSAILTGLMYVAQTKASGNVRKG